MPEEINRVVTDRLSDYLFAPSADAVANLRAEGHRPEQIELVGNVMVDTLLANRSRAAEGDTLSRLDSIPVSMAWSRCTDQPTSMTLPSWPPCSSPLTK